MSHAWSARFAGDPQNYKMMRRLSLAPSVLQGLAPLDFSSIGSGANDPENEEYTCKADHALAS